MTGHVGRRKTVMLTLLWHTTITKLKL